MKFFTYALLCMFMSLNAYTQFEGSKQVFSSPNMATQIKLHKTVAILPFISKITFKKQPKDFNQEAHLKREKEMGQSVQSSMFTFLLRKSKSYTVSFQDIEKTNILLKKAGVFDKLDEYTKEELAKILGVDALISGRWEIEQTKSEAGAIISTVLFGGLGSKTGSGSLTLLINDGAMGDILWRFYKSMNDDVFKSTDEMVDRMMRKLSRNFPYSI